MKARGLRYPMTTVARARELHAAGWTAKEIARVLHREGLGKPHYTTVRIWTDPEYAAEHARLTLRRQAGRRAAAGGRLGRRDMTDEFKRARMRDLIGAGVPSAHVARVMNYDFGSDLTGDDVRCLVLDGQGSA